jgi:hypothetical protein
MNRSSIQNLVARLAAAAVCCSGFIQAPGGLPPVEKVSEPIIVFQHDGRDTTGYALYARRKGGREQRIDLGFIAPDESHTVRVPLPGLAPGTYVLAVAAYNRSAESPRISVLPPIVTVPIGSNRPDDQHDAAVTADSEAPTAPTATSAPAAQQPATQGVKESLWARLKRMLFGTDTP